jgi:type III secretion system needle length determinant
VKTGQSSFGLGQALGTPAGRQDERPPQGRPQDGDVDRFETLLAADSVTEPAAAPAAMPTPFTFRAPGDAMLRGMAGGAAAGDSRAVGRLIETIASRVLVGDGSCGGMPEVRIEVGADVFPGLEIRVLEERGRVVVAFATARSADLALLRARSAELATRLEERTGREVELRFARREEPGEPAADHSGGDP